MLVLCSSVLKEPFTSFWCSVLNICMDDEGCFKQKGLFPSAFSRINSQTSEFNFTKKETFFFSFYLLIFLNVKLFNMKLLVSFSMRTFYISCRSSICFLFLCASSSCSANTCAPLSSTLDIWPLSRWGWAGLTHPSPTSSAVVRVIMDFKPRTKWPRIDAPLFTAGPGVFSPSC